MLEELIGKMMLLAREEKGLMIKIKEAVIVEGKYDKIKLSSF